MCGSDAQTHELHGELDTQDDRHLMPRTSPISGFLLIAVAMVCVVLAACGEETTTEPIVTSPEGVWRLTDSGVAESTLRLAADGSFSRVVANLAGSSCESSSGTWRVDGETLRLQINTLANASSSIVETYAFAIESGRLRLGGAASSEEFTRTSSMVSCVDYGFGSWTGLLSASVDSVEFNFTVADILLDVDGGQVEIEGLYVNGEDQRRLLLQVDGSPGPLDTGSFTVQNVPGATDTFYGFYDPDPTSVTFSGFDTTRLLPPGTFTLSAIAPERVAATFSFRANPRVEGEVGPSGAMFAQIDSGRIDLVYQ